MYGRPEERTITVSKERLIKALRENRETHQEEFQEAWRGYWSIVEKKVADMLEQVKKRNHSVSLVVDLKAPKDHTKDYDLAIEALEWELKPEVEITHADFRRYVKDEWDWQSTHKFLHANYSRGISA